MFKPFKLIDKSNNLNASTSTAGLRVNSTLGPSQKQYKSLIFNSASSQYLSRTPISAGNRKTWTWSGWVKRSESTSGQHLFIAGDNSNIYFNHTVICFESGLISSSQRLYFASYVSGSYQLRFATTQFIRDFSSWYHLIVSVDTTQATSSNRVKIYINGSEVTAFDIAEYPTQNLDIAYINTTTSQHEIGRAIGYGHFGGYLTEIHFIDGQAPTPSSFGYFDSLGIWQPKRFSGAYGRNGFYLPFNDSSFTDLVKDKSGNNNNWSLNGYSNTSFNDAVVSDSPVNNFCSLNPLSVTSGTFTRGNLRYTGPSVWKRTNGNIAVSSGKWYWEVTLGNAPFGTASGNVYNSFGWGLSTVFDSSTNPVSVTDGVILGDNQYYKNFTNAWQSLNTSFSSGDTLGCAIDLESNIFTFYRNGSQLIAGTIGGTAGRELVPVVISYDGTYAVMDCNFGQKPFRYSFPSVYKRYENFNTGMLSQLGLSAFIAAQVIDNDINTIGFHTDAAGIGSYLQFDLGAGVAKNFRRIRIQGYKASVAGVKATWDVEYSDNGSTWTKVFTGINMDTIGTNDLGGGNGYFTAIRDWPDAGAHRYWRIYKTNGASGGDYHQGVDFYEIDNTTGFKTLCTANLPIPSITNGKNGMDAITYIGGNSVYSNDSYSGYLKLAMPLNANETIYDISSFLSRNISRIKVPTNLNVTFPTTSPANTNSAVSPTYSGAGLFNTALPGKITIPNNEDFKFGTGDFTVEVWARFNSFPGTSRNIVKCSDSNSWANGWSCVFGATSNRMAFYNGGTYYNTSTDLVIDTWYHLAWTRENGTLRQFINGVLSRTDSSITTNFIPTADLTIGADQNNSWSINGYLQDLRVYKGVAKYTSNFTPTKIITTETNSATKTVSGLNFQPDLLWTKGRSKSGFNHLITDSTRGNGNSLITNETSAQGTRGATLLSNGFSYTYPNEGGDGNFTGADFAAWTWKKSLVYGLDIVTYIGNNAARTIPHSLGVVPKMMIVKQYSPTPAGGEGNWDVYHASLATNQLLYLDLANAAATNAAVWNNTRPTSSVFSVGNDNNVNKNGASIVAYLFAEIEGFSKIGSYTGNGSSDGPFVYCGFKPKWILFKNSSSNAIGWQIHDSTRSPFNVVNANLYPNAGSSEQADASIDFLSNGFKLRSGTWINDNTNTIIFAAFAEYPFKYSRAR